MARLPEPTFVEAEGEYYHVRFREPSDFSEIRTPGWATVVAEDVTPGSKVRMGQRKTSGEWVVQSVLIPGEAGKAQARRDARAILKKIES